MSGEESCRIELAVRVRPMNAREEEQGVLPIINASEERKEVTIVRGSGNRQTRQTYTFDHVFTGYTTQSEVFDPMQPMIDSVMQGYEATVFAYGQTGTGKTHTMEGDVMDAAEKGVIPRSVEAIFERLSDTARYSEFSVSASYLEIYNEVLTDLLVELPNALKKNALPNARMPMKTPREDKSAHDEKGTLEVREDKGKGPGQQGKGMFVNNLSEHTVRPLLLRRRASALLAWPRSSARRACTPALEAQHRSVLRSPERSLREPPAPPPPLACSLPEVCRGSSCTSLPPSPRAGDELGRRAAADPAGAGAAAGAGDQHEQDVEQVALRLHTECHLQVPYGRRPGRVCGQAAHGRPGGLRVCKGQRDRTSPP